MRYHKASSFNDPYHGDGWFVSFWFRSGYLLIAFRWRWRFAFVGSPPLLNKWRLYVGPVELEHTK